MQGLLSLLDNPQAQLGMGLLAAAGPQAQPMSFGQRLMMGVQPVMQMQAAKRQEEEAKRMRDLQAQLLMAQLEDRQTATKERQGAAARAGRDSDILRNLTMGAPADGMGPPTMRPSLDPQAFLGAGGSIEGLSPLMQLNAALTPKRVAPMVVAPGSTVLDGETLTPRFTAPSAEAKAPTSVQEYEFARTQGFLGSFEDWKKGNARAGATSVNVTTGQRDANWGTPPKDTVWARDQQGNVLTERDPASGAFRPVAVPVGGSPDARQIDGDRRKAADTASRAFSTIDQMLQHPGLNTAVGLSGQIDPRNVIWGTDAQGARALIDQAQGQAFLQAFESLKGGGQITQVEGEKATAAIARLQRAQSERDFRAAAKELKDIADTAHKRATGRPLSGGAQGGNTVTVGGKTYTFPTAEAAAEFRRAAGQ
jgi:hypothetical protein